MDIRLNTADDSAYDALSDDLDLPGDDLLGYARNTLYICMLETALQ